VHLRSEGPAARVAAGLALDRCRSTWAVSTVSVPSCCAPDCQDSWARPSLAGLRGSSQSGLVSPGTRASLVPVS
jgi:hypothetical protein